MVGWLLIDGGERLDSEPWEVPKGAPLTLRSVPDGDETRIISPVVAVEVGLTLKSSKKIEFI